jgi:hypothetical protein
MSMGQKDDEFEVEVKHQGPGRNRYTWQIRHRDKVLPIRESRLYFPSWQDADDAGNQELRESRISSGRF